MVNAFNRSELMANMTENLKMLRSKLNLTQDELAGKIGISRQTLVNIENGKREMSWNTFVALIAVFRVERSTSDLLVFFKIYTAELSRYFVSPENVI